MDTLNKKPSLAKLDRRRKLPRPDSLLAMDALG
jgi:hypothetical protein